MNYSSHVCVIVPVLNQENNVEQILAAVKDQTSHPLKLFVADLGSSDKTVAVVLDWFRNHKQRKLQCVLTCQTIGSGNDPYQIALKHCSGAYTYRLKQGEFPDPDAIETFIKMAERTGMLKIESKARIWNAACQPLLTPDS